MTHVVKCIGKNRHKQFGGDIPEDAFELVDSAINKRSLKIAKIFSSNNFVIYCDDAYENIYFAGSNADGRCLDNYHHYSTFYHVTFFNEQNIKIKKICVNNCSNTVFWITDDGTIYANGNNTLYQMGIRNDNVNKFTPIKICDLKEVIDIQCGSYYAIALCSNQSPDTHTIVTYWTRMNKMKAIPDDIIGVIMKYYNITKVLSCGWSEFGAHGHGDTEQIKEWTEIEQLKDKDIQKIRTTNLSSYFLDSQGIVYVCGYNDYGQLGLGRFDMDKYDIMVIGYFMKNNIRIKV